MMSSNAGLTEVFSFKKLFKWTINNFDKLDESNMERETVKLDHYGRHGRYNLRTFYVVESPKLTAIDPYDGKQYTATFKLKSKSPQNDFSITSDAFPFALNDKYSYYYNINDDPTDIPFSLNQDNEWDDDIKVLTIFVDITGYRSINVSPFKRINPKNRENRLKEMWKNDSSIKFTIKCGDNSIEVSVILEFVDIYYFNFYTFKPFLAATSFFFKDMFESITQNFVEITDFGVEAVQKMVEFCETYNIKEINGYEDELFKIAHKYQMNDLMEFAVEKMSENANTSNIFAYRQLAIDFKLKDFEEWCMRFAFKANLNV